jgi:hypothetical protein
MPAVVEGAGGQQLTTLGAVVDELLTSDVALLSQDELLDAVRGVEVASRRIAAVQHRLVAEVAARNVAGELKYRDTASLLSAVLLLTRSQANDRVNAAELLGPRTSLLGEPLPPHLPATAAALTDGTISPAHTGVIRGLIRELPAPIRYEHQDTAEALLAEHAATMDTAQLRRAATRILGFLHPDGTLTPDRVHRKDRDVSMHRHADGSADVTAHLSPACYALWETILEPLARRRPDDGCGPDVRTPGQRRHDAIEDAAKRLLRTGNYRPRLRQSPPPCVTRPAPGVDGPRPGMHVPPLPRDRLPLRSAPHCGLGQGRRHRHPRAGPCLRLSQQ